MTLNPILLSSILALHYLLSAVDWMLFVLLTFTSKQLKIHIAWPTYIPNAFYYSSTELQLQEHLYKYYVVFVVFLNVMKMGNHIQVRKITCIPYFATATWMQRHSGPCITHWIYGPA